MDFPTLVLIILGVTVVATVMAAGGLRALLPGKPAARDAEVDLTQEPAQPASVGDPGCRSTAPEQDRIERDDPADNFFSDEDDYAFREPAYNRGEFSQREEDRDSLEDPDRNR